MRFIVLLDPQLQLLAYSECLLSDPTSSRLQFVRLVFEADGKGNDSLETKEFSLTGTKNDRSRYRDAGYAEVTSFATKCSTFQGHYTALQKFNQLFRTHWERGTAPQGSAQYVTPLNATLTWARRQPGIGSPGQIGMSLHFLTASPLVS